MAKYSFEFKMHLVKEYLDGKAGHDKIAAEHGVDSHLLRRWINGYQHYGEKALMRSRQKQVYPFEFKLHVVELYLTSELSYRELALQVGITDSTRIAQWVSLYRAAGPEALKPKKKGRQRTMDKEKIVHEIENGESEEQKELLKQLQEENLRLRIENAYLKELRRLRLEEEALQRKKRESSTASEENSN